MLRACTMNTLVLPKDTVLEEAEGDMRGWGLNLDSLPRETLYQLQDGITVELWAKEGCALQVLSEKNVNLEHLNIPCNSMVAQNQGLEQVVEEACSGIAKLVMLAELPTIEKIQQLVVGVHRT